jgi:hypothetical protein
MLASLIIEAACVLVFILLVILFGKTVAIVTFLLGLLLLLTLALILGRL